MGLRGEVFSRGRALLDHELGAGDNWCIRTAVCADEARDEPGALRAQLL